MSLNKDDIVKSVRDQEKQAVQGSVYAGTVADQYTPEVYEMATRLKMPASVVHRNYDKLSQQQQVAQDYDSLVDQSPTLAKWLQNSENAKLAAKDIENLSYIERQMKYIGSSYDQGNLNVELSDIGGAAVTEAMGGASVPPELRARQKEIAGKLKSNNFGITGFIEQIPAAAANQIPIQLRTLRDRLSASANLAVPGAAAGATAALVAGQLGPQVAAPEELATVPIGAATGAVLGARVGWKYGSAVAAGRMEMNLAYLDYEGLKDETGAPVDKTTALGAAALVGTINGIVEMVGFEKLIGKLPGIRKFTREGIKEALTKPTMGAAIRRYAGNIASIMAIEGGTEAFQAITKKAGELALNKEYSSAEDFMADLFSEENLGQYMAEARVGAQSGGGMTAVVTLPQLGLDVREVKKAEAREKAFLALGKAMESSSTVKATPETATALVEQMGGDGEVYIDKKQWDTYWQSKGMDPKEAAAEVLGDYMEYESLADEIRIPIGRYASRIAPTEHNEFFAAELKLQPDGMSARQALEMEQAMDKVTPEQEDTIKPVIVERLVAAGYDQSQAEDYASQNSAFIHTMAERSGTTAEAILDKYGFEVERGGPVPAEIVDSSGQAVTAERRAAPTTASVPMMITQKMRSDLRGRGYQDEDVAKLTPQQAHAILTEPTPGDRRAAQPGRGDRRTQASLREEFDNLPADEKFRIAYSDPLTGLLNKRAFDSLPPKRFRVAMDGDSLGWFNDNAGHGNGDIFLKEVAQALLTNFGGMDSFRTGGDEFWGQAATLEEAQAKAKTAQDYLKTVTITVNNPGEEPFQLRGIGLSFGIGESDETADLKLLEDKARREASGERAPKAKQPPGVTYLGSGDTARADKAGGDVRDSQTDTLNQPPSPQGDSAVLYQKVFHGTPHKFDQFSLAAIGTGEGAQAYGWGIYFAGKREVADFYRDQLSYFGSGFEQANVSVEAKEFLSRAIVGSESLLRTVPVFEAKRVIKSKIEDERAAVKHGIDQHRETHNEDAPAEMRARYKAATEALLAVDNLPKGNLYQAQIPEDTELLDWDKPLNEQPKALVSALRKIDIQDVQEQLQSFELGSSTGRSIYMAIERNIANDNDLSNKYGGDQGPARAASLLLNSFGIPGLRYLDEGSRKKTWELKHPQGGIVEFPTEAEAVSYKKRNPEYEIITQQSFNYVIWDEKTVTVEAVNDEMRQAETAATETKAFRDWFGDSKVVDDAGKPLVVYHGTNKDFEIFSRDNQSQTGNPTGRLGFFFSSNPGEASRYAKDFGKTEGANVKPVFLSIQNPYRMTYGEMDQMAMRLFGEPGAPSPPDNAYKTEEGMARIKENARKAFAFAEARREELIAEGYDGVIVRIGGMDEFIPFHPEQIKSAIGNRGTFDPNDPNILYQSPVFVSALQKAAEGLKQETGTAEQFLAAIKKQAGVKAEELQWTGLEEYLKAKQSESKKVSKQEIVDFLKANGVQVNTIEQSKDAGRKRFDDLSDLLLETGFESMFDDDGGIKSITRVSDGEEFFYTRSGSGGQAESLLNDQDEPAPADATEIAFKMNVASYGIADGSVDTKFHEYQLPGGENYREVLLKLPTRENRPYVVRFKETNQVIADFPDRDSAFEYYTKMLSQGDRLATEISPKKEGPDFKSSHFDEPNILAHIRLNDRTDADGNKVLFVEEIQSDWHQQGRKKGYAGEMETYYRVLDQDGYMVARQPTREAAEKIAEDFRNGNTPVQKRRGEAGAPATVKEVSEPSDSGIPNAPFKNNAWAELAIKRVLRMAAEEGYSSVAWTTGEQQADRYDLSKRVEKITHSKNGDGTYNIHVVDTVGNDVLDRLNVKEAEIEEIVGKEVAQKIVGREGNPVEGRDFSYFRKRGKAVGTTFKNNSWYIKWADGSESGTYVSEADAQSDGARMTLDYVDAPAENESRVLSGLDLKVGGAGMKGFYDKILPTLFKKVAGKLDRAAKVGVSKFDALTNKLDVVAEDGSLILRTDYDSQAHNAARENPGSKVVQSQEQLQVHSIAITDAMREGAMAGQALFQEPTDGPADDNRGAIHISPDRRLKISILQNADLTTYIHENGHAYLEVVRDMVKQLAGKTNLTDAQKGILKDAERIAKFLGLESLDKIDREGHEKFARAFEAYTFEGQAPSIGLRRAFASFRSWMLGVYKQMKNLNVRLDDDVRGVFDRMLATDEQIKEAKNEADLTPIFTVKPNGMSEDVFNAYRNALEKSNMSSRDHLQQKLLKELLRERKAWWKEESQKTAKQVEAELDKQKKYIALSIIKTGKRPDGTVVNGNLKLDRDSIQKGGFNKDQMKKLNALDVYRVEGGMDIDMAAQLFGYASGPELVNDLLNTEKKPMVVARETRRRMLATYGDVFADVSQLAEQAKQAVLDESRSEVVHHEMVTINELMKAVQRQRSQGMELFGSAPKLATIKFWAANEISRVKTKDLRPQKYWTTMREAGRTALKAINQMQYQKAYDAKQKELLNLELYRQSTEALEESESIVRYLKKFQSRAIRERLGKVNRLDQVDSLLQHYDLHTISNKQIDANKARYDLLKAIEAGEISASREFSKSLMDTGKENYRDENIEVLRGLRDTLRQMDKEALNEFELMVEGEKMVLGQKAQEMADAVMTTGKTVIPAYGQMSPEENLGKTFKNLVNTWLRPATMARLLDGSDFGAWTKNIIEPIRKAVVEKMEPMLRKAQEDLTALYKKHYTVKEMMLMNERTLVPGVYMSLSKWDVISMALNWGNIENRKALIEGRFAGSKPFTESGILQALGTLDKKDWAFVEDTWKYVDTFWPQIEAAQKRRRGVAPPKVEADPFTMKMKDGEIIELPGGYYPLKYNKEIDPKAQLKEMDSLFDAMKLSKPAQSKYAHNQERIGSGGQPVHLTMNVLHTHINNVVRDLALGDAVIYVDKVLKRPELREAMSATGNLDALKTFQLWLKDTAVGEMGTRSGAEAVARFLRLGFTKSKIGFNIVTTVLQLAGLPQTMASVGHKYFYRGGQDYLRNPKQAIQQVMAQSKFMHARYELNAFNKDIQGVQEALKSGSPSTSAKNPFLRTFLTVAKNVQLDRFPVIVNWMFLGIRYSQMQVDTITWLAGYNKAKDLNLNAEESIKYADSHVDKAQGSGIFSDRSSIERGTLSEEVRQTEFVKLWTTLMSYMIAKGNIAVERGKETDFKKLNEVLSFGTDMLLLFSAEILLTAMIKGDSPGEDESWWWWLAKRTGEQVVSTIPVLREIPSFVKGYGASGGPLGAFTKDIGTAINQTMQLEFDKAFLKSYINIIGTLTGGPSVQFNRLVDAYWRETEGEDVPAIEYLTGSRN